MQDRFFKRLRKKAKKGMRGWPVATIAFYGPDLSRASKVAVGVVPHENAPATEMRAWKETVCKVPLHSLAKPKQAA